MSEVIWAFPPSRTPVHFHQSDGIRCSGRLVLVPINGRRRGYKILDVDRGQIVRGQTTLHDPEDIFGGQGQGFIMMNAERKIMNYAGWGYSRAEDQVWQMPEEWA